MRKVLISQAIHQAGMDLLAGKVETIILPDASVETAQRLAADVEGLILRTNIKITREIIDAAPHLKVISRTGAGVDNIDVAAASERGILVCNTPGVNAISVAEHTVALIMALTKTLPYFDREVRQGRWKSRYEYRPVELRQKTLGVIGFGKIGSRVAEIMQKGFDMQILAYDPYVSTAPLSDNMIFCELDELLSQADIISLHLPATPETTGLLTRERLAMLKPSAYFVNAARGSVVDENALIECLQARKIAGAGLDVFAREPLPGDHPLTTLDNVILSPHAGALSKECVAKVAIEAAQAVLDVFAGREPKYVYNSVKPEA